MNDPEGFLSRWARRKRDVTEAATAPADAPESGDPESKEPDSRLRGNERSVDSELSQDRSPDGDERTDKTEAEFDLSKLPSIDSITAETDIRPFLARGVPADLRQAALRRVWVADPHIRDFIGIAENQGDFTSAGNMPGFDFSPPTGDIGRMIAEIFGEKRADDSEPKEKEPSTVADSPDTQAVADHSAIHRDVNRADAVETSAETQQPREPVSEDQSVRRSLVQRTDDNGASQNDDAMREEKISLARRSHGGAMPK